LTKKTDKHETIQEPIQPQDAQVNSADAVVSETTAAEQESYTLTAEEFAAARAHIEAITKEKDETVSLLQRIQADFDNFRRRNASIRLDSYEEGKRDTVKELLPALDNLERALDAIPAEDASLREGIAMVQRQMLDSLKKLGLEEIESDCIFDPTKHEAVMREKVEGKESGEIVVVFQKGYRMGGRIIRHCMVKVAE
jgi:molecular chaperone GrpE